MGLLSKLLGIILILTVVKKSSADISCHLSETIDIKYLKRVNGSYIFDGREIPAHLIGKYNYTVQENGSPNLVVNNLRACVCKERPCVPICCPRKNMLPNGTCNDNLKEEIVRGNRFLNLNSCKGNGQYNLLNLTVIRDMFLPCDKMFNIGEDEFTIHTNGTLIIDFIKGAFSKEDYCLYPQFHSEIQNQSISVAIHICPRGIPEGFLKIMMMSLVCFILTIAVYLYVRKLRNLFGKCLVSCLFSMFMEHLIWILDQFDLLYYTCAPAGYSKYFFEMASHLWFSIVSFCLWNVITSINYYEPRYQFEKYSAFVWITAAISTGVIYVMNGIWEKDLQKWNWMPLVGFSDCAVKVWDSSSWIYYQGPIMILGIFNLIMFVLTAIYILKVKREINRFIQTEISTIFQSYIQFLRLFAIMGVSLILLQIMHLAQKHEIIQTDIFIKAILYFHSAFGIIIFVLFILKRSTLRMLRDRYRGRKKKKELSKGRK
ncbi:probable G-protein coupled receptor Mth-like 12 [Drosophila rhopaloa]|uniref:G-protein coupled receptors family 2 profile 2 domain-containing protein n=1 Tax=Drosophila rhopaloa TaxID=1041015 RepID=A0ABM5HAS6_DRORH|nr:probable G-protein coupled receptor Mth-like 12 [Drosophila rhopaloa]